MACVGFSIDNLSLMALVVSVGFVVDDAIVMIENVFRNIEDGMTPYARGAGGARQIGFTVLSISHLAAGRLHSTPVHGRACRAAVARVLGDAGVCNCDLDLRVAVGHSDDLRAFRQARSSPDATWFDRVVEAS